MLKIENLTKMFGQNTAVDNVSICVGQPKMIGIIGRSGAGKSTLLRIMNRMENATCGTITFDGTDVTAVRGAAKRAWHAEPPFDACHDVQFISASRHSPSD